MVVIINTFQTAKKYRFLWEESFVKKIITEKSPYLTYYANNKTLIAP